MIFFFIMKSKKKCKILPTWWSFLQDVYFLFLSYFLNFFSCLHLCIYILQKTTSFPWIYFENYSNVFLFSIFLNKCVIIYQRDGVLNKLRSSRYIKYYNVKCDRPTFQAPCFVLKIPLTNNYYYYPVTFTHICRQFVFRKINWIKKYVFYCFQL